jgi:small subunit ribosomal protein S8
MAMSDPIADMLTRIRNANSQKHATVDVPASRIKTAIADILAKEGYVRGYDVLTSDSVKKTIRITLKYGSGKDTKVITGIRRISKPGLRVYTPCEKLPKVLGGLGTAIVSTSKGLVTDKEARKLGVGGEIIAFIW